MGDDDDVLVLAEESSVPLDAWAFRLYEWKSSTGDELVGVWHRTGEWFRRNGTYCGLRSQCGRVYNIEKMELVGAPNKHPIGYLCQECFGMQHSDELTK